MPRRPRTPATSRSEQWLRILANDYPGLFQSRFSQLSGVTEDVHWLSPVRNDEYAEYYDEAFLKRLGIGSLAAELSKFWPSSGPRWDGLARTTGGRVILIEAKAHLDEVISDCSAGVDSLFQIRESLESVKKSLGVPESRKDVSWTSPYYQFCNRIAHLYFLRSQGIDAHLVFLHFADAPDVPKPVSAETWHVFSRHIRRALALDKHALSAYDHDMIISVNEIKGG